MAIRTNPYFWDCECGTGFIHSKDTCDVCPVCGAHEEDMPDATQGEVEAGEHFAADVSPAWIANHSYLGSDI